MCKAYAQRGGWIKLLKDVASSQPAFGASHKRALCQPNSMENKQGIWAVQDQAALRTEWVCDQAHESGMFMSIELQLELDPGQLSKTSFQK